MQTSLTRTGTLPGRGVESGSQVPKGHLKLIVFSFYLFSGFCGARVAARPARTLRAAARAPVRIAAASSGYQWLNKEPLALIVGFVG